MTDYAVWAWQTGEGCDHMIGCGSILLELSATEQKEALEEAKALLIERGYVTGSEQELREIHLVQIVANIDPGDITEEEDEDEETAHRRLQYETLKKEFGS